MRAFVQAGAPEDVARERVEYMLGDDDDGDAEFRLFPQNEAAMRVFLRLSGAWHRNPMSGRMVSLAPSEVMATLQLMGVRRREWPTLFDQIKVLESEGIDALHEGEPVTAPSRPAPRGTRRAPRPRGRAGR